MAKRSVRTERANSRSVRLVVVVTLLLTVILAFQIVRLNSRNRELKDNVAVLQSQVTEASEENDELTDKTSRPLSEDEMLEIARERYGLLFPNEVMLVPEDD